MKTKTFLQTLALTGLVFISSRVSSLATLTANNATQYRVDTGAAIAEISGTIPAGVGVYFDCSVNDTTGATIKMEVELQKLPATFMGTATVSSGYVPSGSRPRTGTTAGLTPGSYAWRFRVINSSGVTGNWFPSTPPTTPDFIVQDSSTVPTVQTVAATATATSATINGTIISEGGSSIIDRRFDWGTSSGNLNQAVYATSITTSGNNFSAALTGLIPGTTYYFRAWARNGSTANAGYGQGWNIGSILAFTTSSQCSYSISPGSGNLSSGSGSGSFGMTAGNGCGWSATTAYNWIHTTSSGNGSGTINYTYDANTGSASRTGTIAVGGKTFTVTQDGISCSYSISPTSGNPGSSSGSGTFNITAGNGCGWSATTAYSWIHTTSGGSGNGTVNYTFDANASTSSRSGTITAGGQTFTITQAGTGGGPAVMLPGTISYIRQIGKSDMQPNFNSSAACGPCSAVMILTYYNRLPAHPMIGKAGVNNDYSWYVAPIDQSGNPSSTAYSYVNFPFNLGTPDPSGQINYGAHGFLIKDINVGTASDRAVQYFWKHGLWATADFSPTEAEVKSEVDAGRPVFMSTDIYEGSLHHHILVVRGYNSTQLITADPWVRADLQNRDSYAYTWDYLHYNGAQKYIIKSISPVTAGTKVRSTEAFNVRSTPSAATGTFPMTAVGDTGTILFDSSMNSTFWNADGYTWIKVAWDDGKVGWSAIGSVDTLWIEPVGSVSCSYSISSTGVNPGSSSGSGNFAISTGSGCSWTATTSSSWIHTTSGGSGNGTINYAYDANTSTGLRSGSILVGGQTFTITQSGVQCSYSISPNSAGPTAGSGSGTFSITAGAGCSWMATTTSSWIHTISSSSGNGTISYTYDANTSTSSRSGTILVGGQTFTITQSGVQCSYSISPTSANPSTAAGGGSISVTASSGCAWSASSGSTWIHTSSSGTGNGTVNYTFDANTGVSSRTGTILVEGRTFTITQQGKSVLGDAMRVLPSGYSPGAALTVTINVKPSANGTSYAVEDVPPSGWSVANISDSGVLDTVNHKVKWGPFFDATARSLTYQVTPPAGESGTKAFSGTASFDGAGSPITGNSSIDRLQAHPADADANMRMTIDEMTAYGSAWKQGNPWPTPPTSPDVNYVTRAGYLWKNGETYHCDANQAAPLCWQTGTTASQASLVSKASLSSTSTAIRSLPTDYTPGTAVVVMIAVTPAASASAYAVEDVPPAGWSVSSIDNGGTWDQVNGKVKWGPFFDNTPRTLSYRVTPPGGTSGTKSFNGTASFDGIGVAVGGSQTISLRETPVVISVTGGNYQGLFYNTNDVAPQSSGFFTATVTSKGMFTAKLQLAGKTYSLSGQFDNNGSCSKVIARKGMSPINISLQVADGGDVLNGEISDGTWTAVLVANRSTFNSATNPAPQAGKYTLVIPGSGSSSMSPGGDGFGTITVDASGNVTFSGTLADGTKVSQKTVLSKQGQWPLYSSLYSGNGAIIGWLTFTNQPGADFGGSVAWIKLSQGRAGLYPSGFAVRSEVVGARYLLSAGMPVLNFQNGELQFDTGDPGESLTNQIAVNAAGKVMNLSGNKLSLTITTASGLFKGSFIDPKNGKNVSFSGVLLQGENEGYGYFVRGSESGRVYFGPATK